MHVGHHVLVDFRPPRADGLAGRPLAEFAAPVPGDGGLLQVVVAIAGLGNRADGLRRVVFGVAYPGHQVAAGTDDQLADVVEQLDFIVVANQGQIAFTDQAQRPVEALLFGQRFLAFGNVGMNADHAQGAMRRVPFDDFADCLHPYPFATLAPPPVFHGARPAILQAVCELLLERIDIVGVNVAQPVGEVALEVFAVVADHLRVVRADADRAGAQVEVEPGLVGGMQGEAQAFFLFTQDIFRMRVFGDVLEYRGELVPARGKDRDGENLGHRCIARLETQRLAGQGHFGILIKEGNPAEDLAGTTPDGRLPGDAEDRFEGRVSVEQAVIDCLALGVEDQFVQGDAFGHRRVQRMEFVLALPQSLDGQLAIGNVVVNTEHTDGFAKAPGERHLG